MKWWHLFFPIFGLLFGLWALGTPRTTVHSERPNVYTDVVEDDWHNACVSHGGWPAYDGRKHVCLQLIDLSKGATL